MMASRLHDRHLTPGRVPPLPVILWICVAVCGAACTTEVAPQPPRLARHIEQLLERPESLPTAASPTTAELPAEATPVAAPTAATVAEAQAAPPAADAAPPAAPIPPAPAPAQAAEPPRPAEPAKPIEPTRGAEPAAAHEHAVAKAGRPDRAEKAEKPDKVEKVDKAEAKAAKGETAKVEPAKAEGGVVVPEGADATDLYYSGKRKLEHGDLNGAINDLRASQQLRHSVRTLTLLGRAYFDAGQMGPAEKALKAAGTYDDAMLLLGQLYQSTGKSAQARKIYAQFLTLYPDHAKAEWVRKLLQAL
ncbi:MAG: tetratricopeptide repeat protein [Deltaproteobacteria bacterium]|nr:tetratricopeptide repeat protein [Deltaproteobacteria bacterium]